MKQHYLPQCYLKEFVSLSNKQFYCLNTDTLKHRNILSIKLKRPVEICYEKDFYTIDFKTLIKYSDLGLKRPYILEESFHWYEKSYTRITNKIKKQTPLTVNDAYVLAYAFFDFKIRNKYWRLNAIKRNKKEIINNSIGSIFLTKDILDRFNINEKEAIKSINIVKARLLEDDVDKELHLTNIISRKTDKDSIQNQIALNLINWQWTILQSKLGEFITTDNPGFCIDMQENIHNTRFAPDFAFFIPLSPYLGLFLTDSIPDTKLKTDGNKKYLNYREASNEFIKLLNNASIFYINKTVISLNRQNLIEASVNLKKYWLKNSACSQS